MFTVDILCLRKLTPTSVEFVNKPLEDHSIASTNIFLFKREIRFFVCF